MRQFQRYSIMTVLSLGIACTNSNAPHQSENTVPLGPATITSTSVMNYSATGTTITTRNGDSISLHSYCSGADLVTWSDTTQGTTATVEYALIGSGSLRFYYDPPASFALTATVKLYYDLTGSGGASGLIGTWTIRDFSYEVRQGGVTPQQTAKLDSLVASSKKLFVNGAYAISYTFSSTAITIVLSTASTAATGFINRWNSLGDSARYDVALTKLNPSTVLLLGNKTHESVTIYSDEKYNTCYFSSNAQNAPYTWFVNPTSCPNATQPAWYTQFLSDNAKTAALSKRMPVDAPATLFPRLPPPWPPR
jgi:hypothetical protein